MKPTCSSCQHFHRFGEEPRGYCMLNPPTVHQNNSQSRPTMKQDERCGHYAAGEATVAVKVNPDTPGLAAKAARQVVKGGTVK